VLKRLKIDNLRLNVAETLHETKPHSERKTFHFSELKILAAVLKIPVYWIYRTNFYILGN
jgi:hypothetical protein